MALIDPQLAVAIEVQAVIEAKPPGYASASSQTGQCFRLGQRLGEALLMQVDGRSLITSRQKRHDSRAENYCFDSIIPEESHHGYYSIVAKWLILHETSQPC